MRIKTIGTLSLVMLLICACLPMDTCAEERPPLSEEAVSLKYNLKVGDLFIYQAKNSSYIISGAGMPGVRRIDVEGTHTQVVTKVSKDAAYSLVIADISEITRPFTSVTNMRTEHQRMLPDGRIIESSALAKGPLVTLLFSAGELPSMPVKKGETWKTGSESPRGSSLDIQWTLIGFQKVKGYDCAQLEGTFTGELGKLKLTHSFAVKEGFTIAQKVEVKMKSIPEEPKDFEAVINQAKKLPLPSPEALEVDERNKQLLVDELIKQLKDSDVDVRIEAARRLAAVGIAGRNLGSSHGKRAVESLIAALKDRDIDVRAAAAEALGQIGDKRAVEKLIDTLKDKDPDVRMSAANALGILGDKQAISQLEWVTKEDNIASVRDAAQRALKQLRPPEVKGEVRSISGTISLELELMKKEELPSTKLEETVSALELIASGQAELRNQNYDKAISAFEKAMEVDLEPFCAYLYPDLARAYIQAGSSYGYGPEEVLKLAEELKKRVENDAFSYMKLGDVYMIVKKYDEAIEAYKKAMELRPKYHYFMRKLAQAYGEAGNPELEKELYKEILINQLNDPDPHHRSRAAESLGQIGDKRAIDELERVAREDKVDYVRDAAKKALKEIESK